MKNVLITGGAGFIGSNLALKLIEKGYIVTVLDNLSPQIHGTEPEVSSPLYLTIRGKVKFIKGSVTRREDWIEALKNQNFIVHLAAETGTGQSMYCIERYVDVNICGTSIMLDIIANSHQKISKVIVASSRSIYGEGKYITNSGNIVYPENRLESDMMNKNFQVSYNRDFTIKSVPTDEESKIHPSSVYGITKQNQEQLIMTVCPTIGVNSVAFRYQNVYGPGQSLSNPYTGILSIFSTQIRNHHPIQIFEDGNESRDFVYIDDVVDATILGLELDEANNQTFNVGSGIQTTVLEVAETLVKSYDINVPINITGNFRIGDIRHNFASLEKIHKILGFSPKVDFNIGIKKFTSWVLSQKIQNDNLELSLHEMKEKGLLK